MLFYVHVALLANVNNKQSEQCCVSCIRDKSNNQSYETINVNRKMKNGISHAG